MITELQSYFQDDWSTAVGEFNQSIDEIQCMLVSIGVYNDQYCYTG